MPVSRSDIPPYKDLLYPVLKAVAELGGSARAREITAKVIANLGVPDELIAITYDKRGRPRGSGRRHAPLSILIDRLEWARSYLKLGGAIVSPQRSHYLLSTFGRMILALPEAEGIAAVKEMNREVRARSTSAADSGLGDGSSRVGNRAKSW